MIRIGDLRDRLDLQAPVPARESDGSVTITWLTEASIWGSVRGLSGREYMAAQQAMSTATHQVVVRHDDRITAKKRILWNPSGGSIRTLNIVSAGDIGGDRELMTMQCCEVVNELITAINVTWSYAGKTLTVTFSDSVSIVSGGSELNMQTSVDGITWRSSTGVNAVDGSPNVIVFGVATVPANPAYWRIPAAMTKVVGLDKDILVPQSGNL